MNIYNKCAFRYYLDNVLNLNIYEESFSTIIGNMVHYVMENCLKNDDNDIDKYVSEFLKDKSFTKKEKFFLEKYHNALYKLLDSVLKEKDYYSFNKAMYEEKIDIVYDDNTYFSGIIDKILYKEEDNNTYMALIDYKTGKDNINLKYFKYGIDIQLPIYLYLSRYLNFKNVKYAGFYLQKFNINQDNFLLEGYSNSDTDTLSIMDKNYYASSIIKGLKVLNAGGFAKSSKLLSDTQIDNMIGMTDKMIKNTISNIKSNKFDINPKVDGNSFNGCMYCKYQDICFKRQSDEVKIDSADIEEVV